MEDRGRELPFQGQAEAGLPGFRGDGGVPQGMPRLCRALARRAARGIQAARHHRRLGPSLRHHGLFRRSPDRARADEIRRQRHALSRLQAGDVERGGKNRAGGSRSRVRGLHLRYGVGEVSGRTGRTRLRQGCFSRGRPGRERCEHRNLDHDALDPARQPRHQFLAENFLRPLSRHRVARGQLGENRRSPDSRRHARRSGVQAGARDRL